MYIQIDPELILAHYNKPRPIGRCLRLRLLRRLRRQS
jgi:hypothetical protein